MQATRQAQCSKAGKRQGTHHRRTRANLWQVLKPRGTAHLRTSGHDERHHERNTRHKPQNPLKTPLKCEIEPYSDAMHHKQSRKGTKEGQRDGTHPKRGSRSAPPATQWTPPPPQRESHNGSPCNLKTQIYLKFCPLLSPKFPRKHQSTPKKNSLLPCFAENLPRWTEN